VVIFEADDLESARVHCANDPYVLEGVFGEWDCSPVAQVFPEK